MFSLKQLVLVVLCLAKESLYLEAPSTKTGQAAVLVLLQGASIPNTKYKSISSEIQAQAPFPLHVILPSFALDVAVPNEWYIAGRVRDAMEILPKELKDLPVFISGHSLGADGAMSLAKSSKAYKACVIMGASLNRRFKYNFPTPILSINAELDGLHRVSRVAEAFFNLFDRKSGITKASVASTPVVMLKGQNHLQFADGIDPPVVVKNLDLEPDISNKEAITNTAEVVVEFLCIHHETAGCGREAAMSKLTDRVTQTREFLGPMIEAFRMEGSPRLFTPCNSDTPSPHCPFYPIWPPYNENRIPSEKTDCICGVPFSEIAANTMSGLDNSRYPLINVDAIHHLSDTNKSVDYFFPDGPKRFHHPHVFSNCTIENGITGTCLMNSTTVSEPFYKPDKKDTGFKRATALEIRIKMKSRQVYTLYSSDSKATLEQTDSGSICADINKKSYEWALSKASPTARARFQVYGQPMVMKEDEYPVLPIGPLFINHGNLSIDLDLKFQSRKVKGKWIMYVESVGFKTPNEGFITTLYPDSNGKGFMLISGYHYCKVLSPARVMEHIYTDGLRKNKGMSWDTQQESDDE